MAESCGVTILQYQVSVLCMEREFSADEPHVYGDISQQNLQQTHCVQLLKSVYEYMGREVLHISVSLKHIPVSGWEQQYDEAYKIFAMKSH